MDITWIFSLSIELCAIVMSLIISGIIAVQNTKTKLDLDTRRLVVLGIFLLFCDFVSILYDGGTSNFERYATKISIFFVYFTNYAILISYGKFIYDFLELKKDSFSFKLCVFVGALSICAIIFLICSQFGNWIYYFDESNIYHRGSLYPLSQVVPIIEGFCFAYILILHKDKLVNNQFVAACSYIILPISATIFQTFVYGFPAQNISIVVASWMLFFAREIDVHNQLEMANKTKTTFLHNMSHDIRTPINGIIGMLNIIKNNKDNQEKVEDCLQKIDYSSKLLLSLINDVLDMAKLENDSVILNEESVNLHKFCAETGDAVIFQADAAGIKVYEEHDNYDDVYVLISPLHLRKVLINLFTNAIKYNKPNGSIYTSMKTIKQTEDFITCQFKIRDTGIGMSQEFIDNKLFTPFSQANNSSRSNYMGTGLGTSIVKEIVDKMNGTIEVESKLNEGSCFTVTIPLRIDHNPKVQEKIKPISVDISGLNILVVEDNELNMEIVEYFLTENGVKITKAYNGQEAIQIFESSRSKDFDVILMDIMMPVMDGLNATRLIRQSNHPDGKTIPIIAMTANTFKEDEIKSIDAGMNGHIAKPIDIDNLKLTIYNCLNKN